MNSTLVAFLLYVVLAVVTYGVYRIVLDRLSDDQIAGTDRNTLLALLVIGAIVWPILWVAQLFSIIATTIKAIANNR